MPEKLMAIANALAPRSAGFGFPRFEPHAATAASAYRDQFQPSFVERRD